MVVLSKLLSMDQIEEVNHILKIIIIHYLELYSWVQIVFIRYEVLMNRITNDR